NDASLENVQIADNAVSLYYSSTKSSRKIKATQSQTGWTLEIRIPKTTGAVVRVAEGVAETSEVDGYLTFRTEDPQLVVEVLSGD
ncbi:MAG: hypothetical protein WBM43_05395, partial [Flavobacteriaceae bacterium]